MIGRATMVFVAAALLAAPALAGTSKLLDEAAIRETLKNEAPCCVVDARSNAQRKRLPIANSVEYSPTLRPKAGGYALVMADSDDKAMKAAKAISHRSGADAHGIKGGYDTWQRLQKENVRVDRAPEAAMPQIFTIPSNTCEQGPALQIFKK